MKRVACATCGKAMEGGLAEWPTYPFCSRKCRLIDLGNWLSGEYTILREERDPEDEAHPAESAD